MPPAGMVTITAMTMRTITDMNTATATRIDV